MSQRVDDELPNLPELAMFDRRATRGAVVRGLLRTAMIAVGLYLAFLLAGYVVGHVALGVNDRDDRFRRLGEVAFDVGHPDLRQPSQRGGDYDSGWLRTTNTFRRITPDGAALDVSIEMSTFGDISPMPLADTDLDRALAAGRTDPAAAEAFARGLPASSLSDVVVEFTRPLSQTDIGDVYGRLDAAGQIGFPVAFYTDPYLQQDSGFSMALSGEVLQARPVSWPGTEPSDLAEWTGALRPDDDADLARMGLPDSATLISAGATPMTHGLYLQRLTPATLLALLADPAVRSLTPVSSRLALIGQP